LARGKRTPECDPHDYQGKHEHAFSAVCLKCGYEPAPAARAQRVFTARIPRLLHNPDPFRVPAPPDYSTPEKISARAREAAGSERLPVGGLYAAFRKAVERAGGKRSDPMLDRFRPVSREAA